MLSILPRRGKRAYESFVAALTKTENKEISDILREKEDPRSSQDTVQPKPKDMSHSEKGDNSQKSERPSPATEDKGKQCWPAINLK